MIPINFFLLSVPFQTYLYNIFIQAVGPDVLQTFTTCVGQPIICIYKAEKLSVCVRRDTANSTTKARINMGL